MKEQYETLIAKLLDEQSDSPTPERASEIQDELATARKGLKQLTQDEPVKEKPKEVEIKPRKFTTVKTDPEPVAVKEPEKKGGSSAILIVVVIAVIAVAIFLIIVAYKKKQSNGGTTGTAN